MSGQANIINSAFSFCYFLTCKSQNKIVRHIKFNVYHAGAKGLIAGVALTLSWMV